MNLNRKLILRTTKEHEYVLYKTNEEECREIELLCSTAQETVNDKYPFLKDIQLCGHILEVTESMLKTYIPLYHTWNEKRENSNYSYEIYEYPCYANKERSPLSFSSNVRIHDDRQSAFKCAMNCLNAEYFYILKEDLTWMQGFSI